MASKKTPVPPAAPTTPVDESTFKEFLSEIAPQELVVATGTEAANPPAEGLLPGDQPNLQFENQSAEEKYASDVARAAEELYKRRLKEDQILPASQYKPRFHAVMVPVGADTNNPASWAKVLAEDFDEDDAQLIIDHCKKLEKEQRNYNAITAINGVLVKK